MDERRYYYPFMTDLEHRAFTDGSSIPALGYGVWRVPEEIAAGCVKQALAAGYRLIDTAAVYENERGVGEGIRESGMDRDAIFVTTKLWNSDQANVRAAFERSMELLGLETLDLYLIHWPAPRLGEYTRAWQELVALRNEGLVRSVGVSNFTIEHLERAAEAAGEMPVINQVELHPHFQQRELRAFHDEFGIVTEAWSPLGQGGSLLSDPVLTQIAGDHGRTVAQVVLRWHLQIGTVAIPKSSNPERIRENFDVLDFELSAEEIGRIAELDRNDGRIGPDPITAAF
jgi:2,5-diketo-D-gluconate reductase A